MNESRIEKVQRFSKIWWKSRSDAGKSQEYMALGLGVSKKTIQNWEKGVSSPDLFQGMEWFELLGQNPMYYFLSFLYPFLFEENPNTTTDEQIDEVLVKLINDMTPIEKRQLLFLIAGEHGSSWYSLLQLFTAHCHTTMQSRVATARTILENYEMECAKDTIVCKDNIQPDISILRQAITMGRTAAMNNENGYITTREYDMKDSM